MIAEGDRVVIRELEEGDLVRVLEWINDQEIAYYMGIRQRVTWPDQRAWYKRLKEDGSKQVFAIVLKEGLRHVGNVSLDNINFIDQNARLTIFLGDRKLYGKGLGYDALRAFLGHCFRGLKLHRVYLIVHEENERAIKLYSRCGFTTEGLLREHEFYQGRFVNKLLMGLLAQDFTEAK